MQVRQRKLSQDQGGHLRKRHVRAFAPYVPVFTPVYVWMPRNGKFVSIKGPLDFFTPEELDRWDDAPGEGAPELYVHPALDFVAPFRDVAIRIQKFLSLEGSPSASSNLKRLPPAPYELSDGVLRLLAELWGEDGTTDRVWLTAFVQELCAPIPNEILVAARDQDFEAYESAFMNSAWVVFFALHVGYLNLEFLSRVRVEVFNRIALRKQGAGAWPSDMEALVSAACGGSGSTGSEGESMRMRFEAALDQIAEGPFRQKLEARIQRLRTSLIARGNRILSTQDPEGYLDG